MSKRIAIAGSGKMAKDVGMYFLKKGNSITWISRQEQLLIDLQASIDKSVRMFMKYSGGMVKQLSASFLLYDELEKDKFDVVIECTKEVLQDKKDVFASLEGHIADKGLLFSVSSSILPSQIHEACIGFHAMFPLEMTTTAELVIGNSIAPACRDAALLFCKENDVDFIVQNEKNAFALNRLLLPLQNEVLTALLDTVSTRDVNSASRSLLLPLGQIDLIEKIGPNIVGASVESYRRRMDPVESAAFEPLSKGLSAFQSYVHNSSTQPLLPDDKYNEFKNRLLCLFINTCLTFIEQKQIPRQELDSSFSDVFSSEGTLQNAIDDVGLETIIEVCNAEYKKTGKYYFKPSLHADGQPL